MSYIEKLEDRFTLNVRNQNENYFTITLLKDTLIIGAAQIDKNAHINNISINIEEIYRGKGYGKKLFEIAIKKYIELFNNNEIRFEIYYANNIFSNLLLGFGAKEVCDRDAFKTYVLSLEKYRE